jgi:3-oxoacyl-[acyl-carrier-protein] synthase-3
MNAYLHGIQYCLPERVSTNEDLSRTSGWEAEDIFAKTGIRSRRVVGEGETSSDLGFRAADRLLNELNFDRNQIDALLFCAGARDYIVPATACLLQDRLGLPHTCAAFDYVLGCSGYTYGLWLARSLILSESAKNVLLVTADTPTPFCDPSDLGTVALFGDGGAATLISAESTGSIAELGPTVTGTNGRGAKNLMIRLGGARAIDHVHAAVGMRPVSNSPRDAFISMNGPEITIFSVRTVKSGIQQLLDRVGLDWGDVDLFLFHQANAYMLRRLCETLKIPQHRAPIDMEDTGNTICASIPILMGRCMERGIFHSGQRCVLSGFGMGYSWAMTMLTWTRSD